MQMSRTFCGWPRVWLFGWDPKSAWHYGESFSSTVQGRYKLVKPVGLVWLLRAWSDIMAKSHILYTFVTEFSNPRYTNPTLFHCLSLSLPPLSLITNLSSDLSPSMSHQEITCKHWKMTALLVISWSLCAQLYLTPQPLHTHTQKGIASLSLSFPLLVIFPSWEPLHVVQQQSYMPCRHSSLARLG